MTLPQRGRAIEVGRDPRARNLHAGPDAGRLLPGHPQYPGVHGHHHSAVLYRRFRYSHQRLGPRGRPAPAGRPGSTSNPGVSSQSVSTVTAPAPPWRSVCVEDGELLERAWSEVAHIVNVVVLEQFHCDIDPGRFEVFGDGGDLRVLGQQSHHVVDGPVIEVIDVDLARSRRCSGSGRPRGRCIDPKPPAVPPHRAIWGWGTESVNRSCAAAGHRLSGSGTTRRSAPPRRGAAWARSGRRRLRICWSRSRTAPGTGRPSHASPEAAARTCRRRRAAPG